MLRTRSSSRISRRLVSRRLGRGIAAVAVVAAAAACSSGTTSGASGGTAAGPLTIGISLSLTGDFADPGKAAKRGYELWAEQANASGGVLGRQVQLKIVDDTSSPNQVVTNYQNLITRDKVDVVFGPFSSLLTIPASRVASRYGYAFIEPAGGGPKVFDQKLSNLFFVQQAPVVAQGGIFAEYVLSLPADQRPKTAAYPKLDDPFAAPIADYVKAKFEAAGIRTVYEQTYPAETADLTPVMSRVAAANPDVVVAGTQSVDAYAQVKAMIQLKWSPKWLFMSNGANSPVEFPDKVGKSNVNGIFSSGDWFPGSKAAGSAEFTAAYLKKYGGTANEIDATSAEAYSCGVLLAAVAKKTGKVDNKTLISSLHSGSWSTPLGDLSWDQYGVPQGQDVLVQWVDGTLQAVYPADKAQHAPLTAKPNWAG
jgi:branched-chain amino acid transport system substrate-binding protein